MGSADPFGGEKPTIVDSLKWLKYKIDRGQANRAARKGHYTPRIQIPAGQSPLGGKPSIIHTNTLIQVIIAGIVAAIPLTFYLLQTDNPEKTAVSMGDDAVGLGVPQTSQRQNLVTNSMSQPSAGRVGAIGTGAPSESLAEVMDDTALEHAAKHAQQNYVCPMHPEIISNDPNATCPICGMDLVPLESGGEAGIVKLTPTVMNSLGVRTAKAKRRTLYRRIDSVGYINVDENNIRTISLRSEGWVERLVVKTSGERVTKGQLLMELYAPVLVNAQEEYLQAMRHNNELLINASRDRLIALGVAEEQISNLEETKAVEPLV
ncbi:MAG: efflux RND transporter periplasmic adaptor subunit, partial [Gammaproteobacteria bacterium]